MAIRDITLTLRSPLPCWPGDTPFSFRLAWTRAEGATVNVGAIASTVHIGTHVDAPFHFLDHGETVEALALGPFLGPALVADVRGLATIGVEALADLDFSGAPRLLLRTDGWVDHSRFPESIPVVDAAVPGFLADRGVVLLGLDVPSVDAIDSKTLPIHNALGAYGIAILESVDLTQIEPGVYELIALPLKIEGADGSPVRALLRDL